jgi:tripartite-type tricarboxylate transporter receptor subunit TctC
MIMGTASAVAAQPYPVRPVRMILPNPPGGANDVIGRIVAHKLGVILGQQLVVDNRGGAGGAIGAEIAAGAARDGYTLLAATFATHTTIPHLHKKIPYDPLRGFVPIALSRFSTACYQPIPGFRRTR